MVQWLHIMSLISTTKHEFYAITIIIIIIIISSSSSSSSTGKAAMVNNYPG